jgi:preprotein translocase subunit SecF
MSRLGNITGRLYRGEVSIEFVSRQKLWYTISGIILLVSLLALLFRGLDYSVEFKGGSQWTVPATAQVTAPRLEQIVTNGGGANASATRVNPFNGHGAFWQVQAGQMLTSQAIKIQDQIAATYHLPATGKNAVSVTTVGSSWGSQVTQKAIEALIAFLIVIVIYLSIAFEWRMAASAFVALAHDIVITVGVYALTGFQVSPATIIGLLTILGYSLYDTVVVFDKVRENTAPILGTRKSTYSQAANLALNQTLVRSINTSLTALLPVAAILVVGTLLLGNGELKDLSLVLFVGMLSGTYSSICIATPVLADLKERQPQYRQLAKQVALRAVGGRAALRKAAKSATAVTAGKATGNGGAAASSGTSKGSASASVAGLGDAGTDLTGDDLVDSELADGGNDDLEPHDAIGEAVAATSAASQPRGASARQPGARQQPVRRPAAKRRPSGKKKRR